LSDFLCHFANTPGGDSIGFDYFSLQKLNCDVKTHEFKASVSPFGAEVTIPEVLRGPYKDFVKKKRTFI
jgi:hypothetical protein